MPSAPAPTPTPAPTPQPVAAPAAASAAPMKTPPVFAVKEAGLKTPESVLYDEQADDYLVSNINGSPSEADDNGFISKVSADGKVTDLKWIDGAKPEVKLDAPKGLALGADTLYVADIDHVRMFDRKTGKPKGEITAKGATFLNGIVVDTKGTVYVSDSGVKAGQNGFEPTGTDAILETGKGRAVKTLFKSPDLFRPNGLALAGGNLWANTLGAAELYRIAADGKHDISKLDKGQLDGLVALDDGSFLVSSWEGQTVTHGKPGGPFEVVVHDVKSPAGIGYDSKRHRVLIPIFMGDEVEVYDLPGVTAKMAAPAPLAPPPKPTPKAPEPKKTAAKPGDTQGKTTKSTNDTSPKLPSAPTTPGPAAQ